ncbi:hypothetical protein M885DRAFT_507582 [Pelagophyceae sp. CCMP2097]|nr:hypothetical protein M885DRAFT_507582 [Pelagophyceae sp. CCMP2097]
MLRALLARRPVAARACVARFSETAARPPPRRKKFVEETAPIKVSAVREDLSIAATALPGELTNFAVGSILCAGTLWFGARPSAVETLLALPCNALWREQEKATKLKLRTEPEEMIVDVGSTEQEDTARAAACSILDVDFGESFDKFHIHRVFTERHQESAKSSASGISSQEDVERYNMLLDARHVLLKLNEANSKKNKDGIIRPWSESSKKKKRSRFSLIKAGLLRIPIEWVLAAGPKKPSPKNEKQDRGRLNFVPSQVLWQCFDRGDSPLNIMDGHAIHPRMHLLMEHFRDHVADRRVAFEYDRQEFHKYVTIQYNRKK